MAPRQRMPAASRATVRRDCPLKSHRPLTAAPAAHAASRRRGIGRRRPRPVDRSPARWGSPGSAAATDPRDVRGASRPPASGRGKFLGARPFLQLPEEEPQRWRRRWRACSPSGSSQVCCFGHDASASGRRRPRSGRPAWRHCLRQDRRCTRDPTPRHPPRTPSVPQSPSPRRALDETAPCVAIRVTGTPSSRCLSWSL